VDALAGLALLAASAILLRAGAELFTENASGAARKLQLTLFATAFLLAAAKPEGLITAMVASARHHPGPGGRRRDRRQHHHADARAGLTRVAPGPRSPSVTATTS
jgi:hypothetical protein